MVHIDSMQETSKSGMMWKKNVTENLIFDFMVFTVTFRLMFCNAVSKEVCDRKESVIAKPNYIFKQPGEWLVSFFCVFRYFKTETIVRNQDSRSWHLQIQQSVSASYSSKAKQGVVRKSSIEERSRRFNHSSGKIEGVTTIFVASLFCWFQKRINSRFRRI